MMNSVNYILREISGTEGVGKKKMQKLVYLLERKGLSLNMRYMIHYYGPYSSRLDQYIYSLESAGEVSIDMAGMEHTIKFGNSVGGTCPLNDDSSQILSGVLQDFSSMSSLELEVLTTTDYVAHSMLDEPADKEEIVKEVRKIKGGKFTPAQINKCIESLLEKGYIQTTGR